jgi:Interferon-related developmental regulator (IFRD)
MAKKSRASQRRQKDSDVDEPLVDAEGIMSESYTIGDDSNYNASLFGGSENEDDDEDEAFNDRIIQRGDPGDEAALLAATNRIQYLRDAMLSIQELSHEKRTAKREIYLRRCYKVVSLYATADGINGLEMIAAHCDAFIEACLFALRPRQPPTEQYAACRLIEVVSIALSNHVDAMEQWITAMQETLRRTIISVSRSTPVRMAAVRALSMTIYMATISGASDDDGIAIESLQDLCEALATKTEYRSHFVPISLRASAYDCWSLLATVQEDWTISGQDDVFLGRGLAILPFLKEAVEDVQVDSAQLRASAGECLSLIHEARIHLGSDTLVERKVNEDKGAGVSLNATSRRYQKGSWEGSKYEVLMDEVKQRIAELATQSSHHVSKKDKKEQRANFREYMSTIVDDESPELVINFRNNGNITLSTWKEIIPLNFLRHSLQTGFQTQLLYNPTIQHLFNVQQSLSNSYSGSLSQVEKRLIMSKTSDAYKNADQELRKNRDKRENIKNHFITVDGDDI